MYILPKTLINKIENADFGVQKGEHGYYYISRYTTYGQDWGIDICTGNNINTFLHNIYAILESYDPDEEASVWIGEDGHGKNGAPYHIEDILKDAMEIKEYLSELYDLVNDFHKDDATLCTNCDRYLNCPKDVRDNNESCMRHCNLLFEYYENEVGFRSTFCTPYTDTSKYNNQKFNVLRRIEAHSKNRPNNPDIECLPQWKIRFESGEEIDAFPEEICDL